MVSGPAATAVRSLERFAQASGWSSGAGVVTDPRVIEVFCARGLAGLVAASRGTYRSALRSWAGLADGGRGRRGPGYPGSPAPVPYTPGQRAELMSVAAAQPTTLRRVSALVMTSAGLGAGLGAAELMALRGVDVNDVNDGVVIAVDGARQRQVPVLAPYDRVLAELAADAGQQVLFRPQMADRSYKSAVCDLAGRLATDPAAPRFTLGRARASFICELIAAGTPVAEMLGITGIAAPESLARYAVHVAGAPTSKAAWRGRARDEAAAR